MFHRGTPEAPGLVLGLDRGGACKGVAFRVAAHRAEATIAYLREREQVTMVYREVFLRARLADGREARALGYAVDPAHPQYAGSLDRGTIARFVGQGVGVSGANPDYVRQTYEHMVEIGITDAAMADIVGRLGRAP